MELSLVEGDFLVYMINFLLESWILLLLLLMTVKRISYGTINDSAARGMYVR